jgi:hypothetical protein
MRAAFRAMARECDLGPVSRPQGRAEPAGNFCHHYPWPARADYTPEIAAKICEMLAAGLSLRAICQEPDLRSPSGKRCAVPSVLGRADHANNLRYKTQCLFC